MGNAIQKVCGCSCAQKNENDDKEEIQSNMPQKEIGKVKNERKVDQSTTSFSDMSN